jgi:hypothetical protein
VLPGKRDNAKNPLNTGTSQMFPAMYRAAATDVEAGEAAPSYAHDQGTDEAPAEDERG